LYIENIALLKRRTAIVVIENIHTNGVYPVIIWRNQNANVARAHLVDETEAILRESTAVQAGWVSRFRFHNFSLI